MSKQKLYKIVRFYKSNDMATDVVKRNLTFDEAQLHCRDPLTRKEGEWFDGYMAQ